MLKAVINTYYKTSTLEFIKVSTVHMIKFQNYVFLISLENYKFKDYKKGNNIPS